MKKRMVEYEKPNKHNGLSMLDLFNHFILCYVKINIEDIVYNEIHCERIKSLNVKWMKTNIVLYWWICTSF